MSSAEERAGDEVRLTFTGLDRPGIAVELAAVLAGAGRRDVDALASEGG